MNFHRKTLEDFFLSIEVKNQTNIFPQNFDYVTKYKFIADNLITKIHPYVEKGAQHKSGIFLNDHGPEHIKKVILRATELLNCSNDSLELNEYEIFLLLTAIQIHDIGNIYGRDNHEINSLNVIKALGAECVMDRIEWDCIFDIAEAHGGNPKDKISVLSDEKILNFMVKKKLLAALLKFADELADDRTRADRFSMTTGNMNPLSILHHKFSYCLHTVDIDTVGKQIKLKFDVEEDDLALNYKKITKTPEGREVEVEVSLMDEIFQRTFKTHLERMYCSRFFRPFFEIDRIRVAIEVTLNKLNSYNKREKRLINYDLYEKGYPDESINGFFKIYPELDEFRGNNVIDKIRANTF